ncbi:MAG: sigma-70 family RNA polymerase sigma factor [Acidobacteriota bacterium]|nr:sigma-70 family RNA polymerase sigma factor [Acidobacteriota bacterium]
MGEAQKDVTILLNAASAGDESAPGRLLELVYEDLRRLAGAYMQNERDDHTLQPTALVHEAFIRLVDWQAVSWENRAQFFAIAAQSMRRVLVDHARAKLTDKRNCGQKIALDEAVSFPVEKEVDLLALEEVLQSLEKIDPRQAKIVELRFFGGLSTTETAHVLNISESTVKREWTFARAWFQQELSRS